MMLAPSGLMRPSLKGTSIHPGSVRPPFATHGFLPSSLGRIRLPEIALAMWRRFPRRDLQVAAHALMRRPSFTLMAEGDPEAAARHICRDLSYVHRPLYSDIRRLANRLSSVAGSPCIRIRLEHVVDDACRKFHVDNVTLRLLCTYAGPGTEWLGEGGVVRRMAAMEVALFKGNAYPGSGPRVLHRSPPIETGLHAGSSRLLLCIDAVP